MARSTRMPTTTGSVVIQLEPLEERVLLAVPSTWTPTGIGGTGCLYRPSFSPINGAECAVGTDMGEIFHTTQLGGANAWETLDTQQLRSNSTIGYVSFTSVTGLLFCENGLVGGLPKPILSIDDGQTWSMLSGWTMGTCRQLFADPLSTVQATTKLVATVSSVRSSAAGNWAVYFSPDCGATWTTIQSGTGGYVWLGGAFFEGRNCYIATSHGLKISADGGATWSDGVTTGLNTPTDGFWSFDGCKEGEITRLWAVMWPESVARPGARAGDANTPKLYTVDYNGSNGWVNRTSLLPSTNICWVAVPAGDVDKVFVAGKGGSASGMDVEYSETGGTSFRRIFLGSVNQNVHTAAFGDGAPTFNWSWSSSSVGFAICKTNPNRVAVTNFYGIWETSTATYPTTGSGTRCEWYAGYVSRDQCQAAGTATAGAVSSSGVVNWSLGASLNETSIFDINWVDRDTMIAGCADVQAITSSDSGESWHYSYYNNLAGVNTMYKTVPDPNTGLVYGIGSAVHDTYHGGSTLADSMYYGKVGNYLYVSSDKGNTWTLMKDFGASHHLRGMALDPRHPNRLYVMVCYHDDPAVIEDANYGGLYVTDNLQDGVGATWRQLAPDPATCSLHGLDIHVLSNGTLLATYVGRQIAAGVSTTEDQSGIFVSTDDGRTWTRKTAGDLAYNTMGLEVDPADENIWYVYGVSTVDSHVGGLWRYNYATDTWTQLFAASSSFTAPDSVYATACSPTTNEMYVGTAYRGLWYTPDRTAANPVFHRVATFDFGGITVLKFNLYNPDDLWVGTFGNGMYHGNVRTGGVPAKPASLVVTDVKSSDKVQLSWTAPYVPFGDGFRIEYSTTSSDFTLLDTVDSFATTSYMVTGLSANTTYCFRVKAFSSSGDSEASNIVIATTLVSASLIASDSFNYTGSPGAGWNSGTGFTGYWDSAYPTSITSPAGSLAARPPANTLTTSGNKVQAAGGRNTYRTLASPVGADGTTAWSSYVFNLGGTVKNGFIRLGDTSDYIKFGLPYNSKYSIITGHAGVATDYQAAATATATQGTPDLLVMRIDYKATTGGDRVRLYLNPPVGTDFPDESTCVLDWTATANRHVPRNLSQVALDDANSSNSSQFDEFRLGRAYADVAPGALPIPSAPAGLTATASGRQVTLNWTDVAGEQGYRIYCQPSGGSYSLLETVYSRNFTSYVITSLAANQGYNFKVAAFNSSGESSPSAAVAVTTAAVLPPATPAGISVNVTSSTTATVTWNDSTADHQRFCLEYTEGAKDVREVTVWTRLLVDTDSTGTFSRSITGLVAGRTYVFRLCAVNGGGTSADTDCVEAATLLAPSDMTAKVIWTDAIALSWTNNSWNSTGACVEYSTDGAHWAVLTTLGQGASATTATGLTADTQYFFRARVSASGAYSDYCDYALGRTMASGGTLKAYEPFNYDPGVQANGLSGGRGWSGTWSTGVPTDCLVGTGSLTSGTLMTVGQDLAVWHMRPDFTRSLSTTLGANGATVWFSCVMKYTTTVNTMVKLANAGQQYLSFGLPYLHEWSIISSAGTATTYVGDAAHLPSANTNYLVVVRLDYSSESGGDRVRLYVNPTAGLMAPDVTPYIDWTAPSGRAVPRDLDRATLAISGGAWTDWGYFDELRLGAAYTDVAPTPPPVGPSVLTATAVSGSQVQLSWINNASDNLGYHVYRSTSADTGWTLIQTINSPGTTTCLASGLSPSTVYYFRVSAFNPTGDSSFANTASTRTPGDPVSTGIAAPTNLSATLESPTRLALNWTNTDTSGVGIALSISTDGGFTYRTLAFLDNGVQSSLTVTDLKAGTSYQIKIASYKSGIYTDSAPITASTSLPPTATDLVATAASSSQVNLAWADNSSTETGYQVWCSTDPNAGASSLWQLMAVTPAEATSFHATGLFPNLTYYFRVSAYSGAGVSLYATASATTLAGGRRSVSVLATTATASEAGQRGVFTISRDNSFGPLTVNYVMSGTAGNGVDYQRLLGSVVFNNGDTSQAILLAPLADGQR